MRRLEKQLAAVLLSACTLGTFAQATVPELVKKEAGFWLDASTLTESTGTKLSSWADPRGEGYPVATSFKAVVPEVIEIADGPLQGKKAVTFFSVYTQCDMSFVETKKVRTAFFVVDMDDSADAFLMTNCRDTDSTSYVFHRGSSGNYQLNNGNVNGCTYYNDGRQVANPTGTKLPTGYQLITWRRSTYGTVNALTNDRGNGRVGGKRLCEVITFERELSDVERSLVEGYLKAKWYDAPSQTAAFIEMFGKKAQVHFDASVESSFHYEVEGDETKTLVSQWDDLSGNGNHFTPFRNTGKPIVYGTRGLVNGFPAFKAGEPRSGIDLQLKTRITAANSVIMVADVANADGVFWLGDADTYHFHRGTSGQFSYSNPNVKLNFASVYCDGEKIAAPTTSYPYGAGTTSLFIFTGLNNSCWRRLGSDRANTDYSVGGKQVSELISYGGNLSDSDRILLEDALTEKWTSPKTCVDGAYVHVSASSLTNFIYEGTSISGWTNTGAGGDLTKVATAEYGVRDYTNGVPAFLMGSAGSRIDLQFPRTTAAQSVFWVMDIQTNSENAFWLGDVGENGAYRYHRGSGGNYVNTGHGYVYLDDGTFFTDGTRVTNLGGTRPPAGLHVYDATLDKLTEVSSLSQDRNIASRTGGRALSELLIFTNKVSGLTRKAIREHLQRKWVTTCGWARSGDATWGADKYRVFSSNGIVPAEGATTAGIGFIDGAAELSGGTLTIGSGGVFVSEGAVGAISAPIAGDPVALYGYGTFKAAGATDNRYDFTQFKGALVLGNGGRQTVNAYQPLANIPVTFEAGAKLRIDLTGYTEENDVLATFASITLPAGAEISDLVDFGEEVTGHSCVLSSDGRSILHVNLTEPVTAVWTGGGDHANVNDFNNWDCRNVLGNHIDDAIPTAKTVITISGETSINVPSATSPARAEIVLGYGVILSDDCDWRGLAQPLNGTVVLNGHKLHLAALNGTGTITDSVTEGGEVHLDIPSGRTESNPSLALDGTLKLVVEGGGIYAPTRANQSYTGGTEIAGGTAKAMIDGTKCPWGATSNEILVRSGATFDFNGKNNTYHYKGVVLDGGTLANGALSNGSDYQEVWGCLGKITLLTNSQYKATYSISQWGMIDLNGYKLSVDLVSGRSLYMFDTGTLCGVFTNGAVEVVSGGWLKFGGAESVIGTERGIRDMRTVDLTIDCALNLPCGIRVRDFTVTRENGDYGEGSGRVYIYGTYTPKTSYVYNFQMMDGSVLNLTEKEGAWSATGTGTKGTTLLFEDDATFYIDIGERKLQTGDWVVTWDEDKCPANLDRLRFKAMPGQRVAFTKATKGLRFYQGMTIIVR